MTKYTDYIINEYECVNCGWKQKIWNYKVSKTKCSCGGKGVKNWRLLKKGGVK